MGERAHASSRLTFKQTTAHSAADISTAEATANIGAVAAEVVAVAAVAAVDAVVVVTSETWESVQHCSVTCHITAALCNCRALPTVTR